MSTHPRMPHPMSVTAIHFNPHLIPARHAQRSRDAGNGLIFLPGEEDNLRWQSRPGEPSAHEQALTAAFVEIYANDGRTPDDFARALNARHLTQPDGSAWTADALSAELERLAA